jgi:Cu/Zn superoxide dismutase
MQSASIWWEGEMKRLAILACAALLMAGCGSNNNPNGPSNQPTVFTVALRASNEVPPVTNADTNATGTAVITVNTVRDSSGNITPGTLDFNVTMSGFPNDTKLTGAHIHPGSAGNTGSVLVGVITSGDNITLPNGSGSFTKTGLTAPNVTDLQNIANNPQNFYFNVHTTINPSGAIRGQLR